MRDIACVILGESRRSGAEASEWWGGEVARKEGSKAWQQHDK